VSAADVRLVGEVYDAFARRDAAAVLERLHPDVEIRQTELVPWGGHYRGHTGAREFFGRVIEAIDSRVTIECFIDAGDHVAAIGRTRGHIRANGAAFDAAVVHVWTVRDGRLAGLEVYIDTPTMREALGSA
jgi:ketosteroid isomerase-like protein